MNPSKVLSMFAVLSLASYSTSSKALQTLSVSDVVIGAQTLPTRYLYAT